MEDPKIELSENDQYMTWVDCIQIDWVTNKQTIGGKTLDTDSLQFSVDPIILDHFFYSWLKSLSFICMSDHIRTLPLEMWSILVCNFFFQHFHRSFGIWCHQEVINQQRWFSFVSTTMIKYCWVINYTYTTIRYNCTFNGAIWV